MNSNTHLAIVALLSLVVLAACSNDSSTGSDNENLPDATTFTLNDVDLNTVSLSDFAGKVIVLNFFGTFCPPCQDEMPALEENIWQVYKNQGVQVLAINLKEELGQVKLWQINNNLTYPLLIDETGDVFRAYAGGDDMVANVPYNVVIDKQMKIHYSQTGYNETQMIALIEELLQ